MANELVARVAKYDGTQPLAIRTEPGYQVKLREAGGVIIRASGNTNVPPGIGAYVDHTEALFRQAVATHFDDHKVHGPRGQKYRDGVAAITGLGPASEAFILEVGLLPAGTQYTTLKGDSMERGHTARRLARIAGDQDTFGDFGTRFRLKQTLEDKRTAGPGYRGRDYEHTYASWLRISQDTGHGGAYLSWLGTKKEDRSVRIQGFQQTCGIAIVRNGKPELAALDRCLEAAAETLTVKLAESNVKGKQVFVSLVYVNDTDGEEYARPGMVTVMKGLAHAHAYLGMTRGIKEVNVIHPDHFKESRNAASMAFARLDRRQKRLANQNAPTAGMVLCDAEQFLQVGQERAKITVDDLFGELPGSDRKQIE
jgi:hypothetical protein